MYMHICVVYDCDLGFSVSLFDLCNYLLLVFVVSINASDCLCDIFQNVMQKCVLRGFYR